MTVNELIKTLQELPDKSKKVLIPDYCPSLDKYGMIEASEVVDPEQAGSIDII